MAKIFVLTDKITGNQYFYTTLIALYEEKGKEYLGISKYTLDRVDWDMDIYENTIYRIEVKILKTRGDIIREREPLIKFKRR